MLRMLFVFIQPPGCYIPIKVVIVVNTVYIPNHDHLRMVIGVLKF